MKAAPENSGKRVPRAGTLKDQRNRETEKRVKGYPPRNNYSGMSLREILASRGEDEEDYGPDNIVGDED